MYMLHVFIERMSAMFFARAPMVRIVLLLCLGVGQDKCFGQTFPRLLSGDGLFPEVIASLPSQRRIPDPHMSCLCLCLYIYLI